MRFSLMLWLNLTLVAFRMPADEPVKKVAKDEGTGIPAEAKEVTPGVYRFVDKNGKSWLFRRTPFGVMKTEETKEARAALEAKAKDVPEKPDMQAVEEGDMVRFTRWTPFGVNSWTKKKTELSAAEKEALERSKSVNPAPVKNGQE